jgi:hypothetical protein
MVYGIDSSAKPWLPWLAIGVWRDAIEGSAHAARDSLMGDGVACVRQ